MQFSQILSGLQRADIDYVLVGGLAVFLNGVSRVTMDIDLAVAMNDANLSRFIDFANGLGLKPRIPVAIETLKSVEQIESWFQEKGMIAFSLVGRTVDDLSIDVLVRPVVPFDELKANARRVVFSGGFVVVASPEDLIRMKQDTGRNVDARDIELLKDLISARGTGAKGG